MNIVGVSAFYHDSAACLLRDGLLVAACQEERFSRVKNDAAFPIDAVSSCLASQGLDLLDIDAVGYFEDPGLKAQRQAFQGLSPFDRVDAAEREAAHPLRAIRRRTGFEGPIEVVTHHRSHAASAYYLSGQPEAAVLVADGVGEWATTSFWDACDGRLACLAEIRFPQSLGLAYSALTRFLGFKVNEDEYKVMGLAAYGEPAFAEAFQALIRTGDGPALQLDGTAFDFSGTGPMHTPALAQRLGLPPRRQGEPLKQVHADIAASLQRRLEDVLLGWSRWLVGVTGRHCLALAGGVAHNSVAIGVLRARDVARHLFVQPAAGDAGTALGAALITHARRAGAPPPIQDMSHALGCAHDAGAEGLETELARLSGLGRLPPGLVTAYAGDETGLLDRVVEALAAGCVVGWCDGPMEFGPRALGRRSILADPRRADALRHLNASIKGREPFRPFAPAVLEERAGSHVRLAGPNAFMTETCRLAGVTPLPAVTHADGTARPQTVGPDDPTRFRRLLERFALRTGCPVLLNTSLNVNGMPLARNGRDALDVFLRTRMDLLAVGDIVLDRRAVPERWRDLATADGPRGARSRAPSPEVYTFV